MSLFSLSRFPNKDLSRYIYKHYLKYSYSLPNPFGREHPDSSQKSFLHSKPQYKNGCSFNLVTNVPNTNEESELKDDYTISVSCNGINPPHNIIWQGDKLEIGNYYWAFHFDVLTRSPFVGLTNTQNRSTDDQIQCLCYGGFLTNGTTQLLLNYGPTIQAGDTVEMFVSYSNTFLRIYSSINNHPLGLAFELPSDKFQTMHPIIQLYGAGTVTRQRQLNDVNPDSLKLMENSYLGYWVFYRVVEKRGSNRAVARTAHTLPPPILQIYTSFQNIVIIARILNYSTMTFRKNNNKWKLLAFTTTNVEGTIDETMFEQCVLDNIKNLENIVVNELFMIIRQKYQWTEWTKRQNSPILYDSQIFG